MTKKQGVNETFKAAQDNVKPRILVVDDEADVCSGLVRALNLEGFTAEAANSGYEALSMLTDKPYDLLVLDLRMPGLDGLAVTQQVHRLYPELLIIILTGYATLESAIAATKSDQVVDYLLKPVRNEELIAAVRRAQQKQTSQRRQRRLLEAASQVLEAMGHPETLSNHRDIPETSFVPPIATQNATGRYVRVPPLTLDRQRRVVTLDNGSRTTTVTLTKGETAILACLMAIPNQALSCRRLVYLAWGYEAEEAEAASIIRPYISRLRQKLEPDPKKPRLIGTVRRRGYRFSPSNT